MTDAALSSSAALPRRLGEDALSVIVALIVGLIISSLFFAGVKPPLAG